MRHPSDRIERSQRISHRRNDPGIGDAHPPSVAEDAEAKIGFVSENDLASGPIPHRHQHARPLDFGRHLDETPVGPYRVGNQVHPFPVYDPGTGLRLAHPVEPGSRSGHVRERLADPAEADRIVPDLAPEIQPERIPLSGSEHDPPGIPAAYGNAFPTTVHPLLEPVSGIGRHGTATPILHHQIRRRIADQLGVQADRIGDRHLRSRYARRIGRKRHPSSLGSLRTGKAKNGQQDEKTDPHRHIFHNANPSLPNRPSPMSAHGRNDTDRHEETGPAVQRRPENRSG